MRRDCYLTAAASLCVLTPLVFWAAPNALPDFNFGPGNPTVQVHPTPAKPCAKRPPSVQKEKNKKEELACL